MTEIMEQGLFSHFPLFFNVRTSFWNQNIAPC